jgi:hypothetical protein
MRNKREVSLAEKVWQIKQGTIGHIRPPWIEEHIYWEKLKFFGSRRPFAIIITGYPINEQ